MMTTLIEQIKLKADSIPTNTKENRIAKGAYVDCLIMAKEANKNFIKSDVSEQLPELFRNFIRTNHLTSKWETYLKENEVSLQ